MWTREKIGERRKRATRYSLAASIRTETKLTLTPIAYDSTRTPLLSHWLTGHACIYSPSQCLRQLHYIRRLFRRLEVTWHPISLVTGETTNHALTILIKSIRHRLIIKLITRIDGKSRHESFKFN